MISVSADVTVAVTPASANMALSDSRGDRKSEARSGNRTRSVASNTDPYAYVSVVIVTALAIMDVLPIAPCDSCPTDHVVRLYCRDYLNRRMLVDRKKHYTDA